MGRGRGKGKKLTVVSHEDAGSGEEEKVPVQKRRGRPPQKPLKDGIDEQETEKIEEDDSDNKGTSLSGKDMNHKAGAEDGKRRKRNSQAKDKQSLVKEENSAANKPSPAGGFRHTGSRRKSTPHRAAEAGVKIDIFFSIETPPYPTGWLE